MEDDNSNVIAAIVEQLKSKGNISYQEKRFEEAIQFYSEAINIINNSNSNDRDDNNDDNNDSNNDRDQDLNGDSCRKKNVNQINGNDRLNELHDKVKELNDDHDDDDLLNALDNRDNNVIDSHDSTTTTTTTTSVPTVSNSIISTITNNRDNQSKELVNDILTKCLMNRSICYSQMKLYDLSNIDAKRVLPLTHHKNNNNHHKAFYRLIKNSFDIKNYRDVRFYLSQAIKECGGEHKDFQQFEEELITHTGIPLRPKSTDFEVISELGTGNFSTVYKVMYKRTKSLYAMKVIDVMLPLLIMIILLLLLNIDISSSPSSILSYLKTIIITHHSSSVSSSLYY
jgi:tetratricopeptide (TPR) repeat protein